MAHKAKYVVVIISFVIVFFTFLPLSHIKDISFFSEDSFLSVRDYGPNTGEDILRAYNYREGYKARSVSGSHAFDPYGYYYITFKENDANSLKEHLSKSDQFHIYNEIKFDSFGTNNKFPRAPKWWPPKYTIMQKVAHFSTSGPDFQEGTFWFNKQEKRVYVFVEWYET